MRTARRLYVYLLSGISLGVLLVGLTLLLTVALGALGLGRGQFVGGSPTADREQLSLAAALTVVGLLVWGVHWWFAERSVRSGRPGAVDEHGSGPRALYLTLVLGVTLAFGSLAALALLRAIVGAALDVGAEGTDLASATATFAVTAVAWAYHAGVRSRDLTTRVDGPAAWLPRLYVYGAALVGLVLLAQSVVHLMGAVLQALAGEPPAIGGLAVVREVAATAAAGVLTWGAVWVGHWWYASRLLSIPGWRATGERRANLRLAYYVGALAAAVIGVLLHLAEAVRHAAAGLLAVRAEPGAPAGEPIALGVGAEVLGATVWLAVVLLHRRWVRAEALEYDDSARSATVDRIDAGVPAVIGLVFAGVGAAWVAGIAIDVLLGGGRSRAGDVWLAELSRYLALGVVGIGPWIWNWSRLQARAHHDPSSEAASPVRRSGLLLIIGGVVLVSLGSLAVVLYRLFGALLGAGLTDSVSALSTPLGILLVTVPVGAYYAVVLRRDQRQRAEDQPSPEPHEPIWPVAPVSRGLRLTGPDGADLDSALRELRASLPPGYQLIVEEEEAAVTG